MTSDRRVRSEPSRSLIARELLENFLREMTFERGHRFRLDILAQDFELNTMLRESGFSQKEQSFLHFEADVSQRVIVDELPDPELSAEPKEAAQIASVLSNLHSVSEAEVLGWIQNQSIRVHRENGQVICAAQVFESEEFFEINRIATHERELRRGAAKKLLEAILQEARSNRTKRVFLKVESVRLPAIALYEAMGFVESESKSQIWHSHYF